MKAALAESQRLLHTERDTNLAKAQELLAEIETLIRQLDEWLPDPPPERFESMRQEIVNELLPDLYGIKLEAYDRDYEEQLRVIAQMGEIAMQNRDALAWADANRRLDHLHDRIISALKQEQRQRRQTITFREGRAQEPSDPRDIKLALESVLAFLRGVARQEGRLPELEADCPHHRKH